MKYSLINEVREIEEKLISCSYFVSPKLFHPTKEFYETISLLANAIHKQGREVKVVVCGDTGVGKTTVLESLRRVYSHLYGSMTKIKAVDMINSISNKEGYIQSGQHLEDGLMIDDLGAEHDRYIEFGQEIKPFEKVIDDRSQVTPNGALLISTNLLPSKIKARYGDRIYSRLREGCIFINMKGKDMRYE